MYGNLDQNDIFLKSVYGISIFIIWQHSTLPRTYIIHVKSDIYRYQFLFYNKEIGIKIKLYMHQQENRRYRVLNLAIINVYWSDNVNNTHYLSSVVLCIYGYISDKQYYLFEVYTSNDNSDQLQLFFLNWPETYDLLVYGLRTISFIAATYEFLVRWFETQVRDKTNHQTNDMSYVNVTCSISCIYYILLISAFCASNEFHLSLNFFSCKTTI